MNNRDVTNIGTNRQLFLDSYWIEHESRIARRLHSPEPRETVLGVDSRNIGRPDSQGAGTAS